jgi:mannosyl-oligosaccharide glucosidase
MAGYGWDRYDPRKGGVQTIHDSGNEIDITTSFVKDTTAGDKGGNWAVRISGTPRPGANTELKTTLMFSIASLSQGLGVLEVEGESETLKDPQGLEGDVVFKGQNPELGSFNIRVTAGQGERPQHNHPSGDDRPLERSFVASVNVPEGSLWQSKREF